ncbi:MAG: hypothetical protein ACJ8H8_17455 [Geminicoccaceae bacterium]
MTLLVLGLGPVLNAPAGWAASGPFETMTFAYRPPEQAPKGERNRYVDEAPDIVFERIWSFLEESGLSISSVDPQQRIIVAEHNGDPRTYLDCGTVIPLVGGAPGESAKPFSAAKSEIRTTKTVNKRRYGLLRQLGLDMRLTVKVEPRGRGARVYSEAIYVATKSVHRLYKGGRPGELLDREVISFLSDSVGRFAKGTRCVGTGKIEALPLVPFKKTS